MGLLPRVYEIRTQYYRKSRAKAIDDYYLYETVYKQVVAWSLSAAIRWFYKHMKRRHLKHSAFIRCLPRGQWSQFK